MKVNGMRINNKEVQEAKLNGQIVYKLISDIEPPSYLTLRVTNISRKDSNGNWSQMAQQGDKIRIIVTMNEELDSSYYPMLKINEKVISRRMGHDNNMKAYTYDYTIQDEQDGELEFEIYDYRDLAGNIGRTLTNEDFNVSGQTSITVDNTPPIFDSLIDETVATTVDLKVTDENFDYILLKNLNTGTEIKERREWTSFSVTGTWTAQAYDLAGNTSALYTFTIDKAPTITIKTGVNETIGNATDGYTKISFKLYDDVGIKEYELNGIKGKISVSQWSDLNNITTSFNGAVVGLNTLIVRDTAGNETTIEFKLVEG